MNILKFYNVLFTFFFLSINIFYPIKANEEEIFLNDRKRNFNIEKFKKEINTFKKEYHPNWKIEKDSENDEEIHWMIEKDLENDKEIQWTLEKDSFKHKINEKSNHKSYFNKKVIIESLNRSLILDGELIGPDISWMVPPGFKWSNRYKFDSSIRGFSRRKTGEPFFGWNGGDAVGQIYYQFLNSNKSSLGLNLGIRSVYYGEKVGGNSYVGEGLSAGFRYDRSLSPDSGFAFGGEQILHFDGLTDTGRDFYLSISKAWWKNNKDFNFPLFVSTAALATGKMAEGTVNILCSDLFGGSGTELAHERRLCWAPVFSLATLFNENLSVFFEHNSYYFIFGSSLVPVSNIPLRITFATVISDHIHNYQIKGFDEISWVFRISLGL